MKKSLLGSLLIVTIVSASEAVTNPTNQRLMSLPEAKRNEVWTLMFRGSNERCGTVTKSFYQGSYEETGSAFWNIRCSNGPDYQVMIENDAEGSTKILECAIVKLLHGECFKTFEEMDRQTRAAKKLKK
jgi:hypothetical protein